MIRKEEIDFMRNDPEIVGAIKRGLEARRNGERVHWNDVKVELGIDTSHNTPSHW